MDKKIINSELLHEIDWIENKTDFSIFEESLRFDVIFRIIKKNNPDFLFDIGCGSGYLASIIKNWKADIKIHGCDISSTALERAKQYCDLTFKVNSDIEDIPIESDKYNFVVCSEVIEHLFDVKHGLMEIHRILKNKGVAVLTVPNLTYFRYRWDILRGLLPIPANDERHLHQFTQKSFARKIEECGLVIFNVSGCRAFLPWIGDWKPSLFSDTLVFEVCKM